MVTSQMAAGRVIIEFCAEGAFGCTFASCGGGGGGRAATKCLDCLETLRRATMPSIARRGSH